MRTLPLLAGAVALSAVLAGCSDDPAPRRAAPPAASPPAPATVAPSATPAAATVRLTGDGIDTAQQVLVFGDAFEQAEPVLRATLGAPTDDSGVLDNEAFGACPGSKARRLEWGGGALRVQFGDVIGPGMTMYSWELRDTGSFADMPRASALVGDVTTYEFGPGETLAALRAGTTGSTLEVVTTDTDQPETVFRLMDQSSGFSGYLTGPAEQDTVAVVQAGEICGE